MKRLILFLTVLMFAFTVQAQQRLNFSPATNDSIVGAATKYCTLTNPITQKWSGCIEVYITPSISSSDSTHVWIEGSQNGSTWYKLTALPAPDLSVGTYYSSNASTLASGYAFKGRMGTAAAGWMWTTDDYIFWPYVRVAVQHFKAATSVKITRAAIYLKK